MSSNNRARSRAIRAEMSTTGDTYSRAARTAGAPRPGRNLRAVCFGCRTDIPAGGGVVHISHHEINRYYDEQLAADARRAARAATEGRQHEVDEGTYTFTDLMDHPPTVRWQVHCDVCNPHTDTDTGASCEGCYWFAVERCTTWAQLVDWTVHLSEKDWVLEATDWMESIRAAAHGDTEVGLICHPDDRFRHA